MITVAFFNNKGGVGKTSLCHHLAWMFGELGVRVVVADYDPQANLTSMFIPEDRLDGLWPEGDHPDTVAGCLTPIAKGLGDIARPHIERVAPLVGLIVGDLALSRFEARLSKEWPDCLAGDQAAFRSISALHRILRQAGVDHDAQLGLIDVGPNLGAINRSALLAADFIVTPLAPDLFSLQGLRNLGPQLVEWRREWDDRLERRPREAELDLPKGSMSPIGYVIMQHATRLDRPVKAYKRWMDRIPPVYASEVLRKDAPVGLMTDRDPACLASLKNYRSLMPLAQDALKPTFLLRPADGAIGGHMTAVQSSHDDFVHLAKTIAQRIELDLPDH